MMKLAIAMLLLVSCATVPAVPPGPRPLPSAPACKANEAYMTGMCPGKFLDGDTRLPCVGCDGGPGQCITDRGYYCSDTRYVCYGDPRCKPASP